MGDKKRSRFFVMIEVNRLKSIIKSFNALKLQVEQLENLKGVKNNV